MSPQQLLGEEPAPSDDIYALGVTLYEMLSSKPPFYNGDIELQVREVVAPPIAQRRVTLGIAGEPIPKRWEETIAACLAKTPEQRPRSAAEVANGCGWRHDPPNDRERYRRTGFPTLCQTRRAGRRSSSVNFAVVIVRPSTRRHRHGRTLLQTEHLPRCYAIESAIKVCLRRKLTRRQRDPRRLRGRQMARWNWGPRQPGPSFSIYPGGRHAGHAHSDRPDAPRCRAPIGRGPPAGPIHDFPS